MPTLEFIRPDWKAPANVSAAVSTRAGGVSKEGFSGLNLGDHVGDSVDAVLRNRSLLTEALDLKNTPAWLSQQHGIDVVCADEVSGQVEADASWSDRPDTVCAILTADCLPVLFCDRNGNRVAAAHAGWRGLQAGILENTLDSFVRVGIHANDVLVWLGPAIGAENYEIDSPVREAVLDGDVGLAAAFTPTRPGHWNFDIYNAARHILASQGVMEISGGGFCTYSDPRLFSYRRQPLCGRQASLVWITS